MASGRFVLPIGVASPQTSLMTEHHLIYRFEKKVRWLGLLVAAIFTVQVAYVQSQWWNQTLWAGHARVPGDARASYIILLLSAPVFTFGLWLLATHFFTFRLYVTPEGLTAESRGWRWRLAWAAIARAESFRFPFGEPQLMIYPLRGWGRLLSLERMTELEGIVKSRLPTEKFYARISSTHEALRYLGSPRRWAFPPIPRRVYACFALSLLMFVLPALYLLFGRAPTPGL